MEIKAKFKGKDGSLNYQNGFNYKLRFTIENTLEGNRVKIKCLSHPQCEPCLYNSLKLFLNNWQVLD